MKIVLLGYMGVGKSTIGKKIAQKLDLNHIDLDDIIETKEQMSIENLFQNRGEMYFRKQEAIAFKELMYLNEDFVLSLGGGTPCYANNHLLLNENNIVSIYLQASLSTLIERLKNERKIRPLLAQIPIDEWENYIGNHLFERSYYYHHATLKINVDFKSIDEIVNEIVTIIKN